MEKRQIIRRGRLTYYISESSVVVGISKYQFISYNIYNSPSRSSLVEFKKHILKSKENELDNVVDQMDLARRCNLVGTGTQNPRWEE